MKHPHSSSHLTKAVGRKTLSTNRLKHHGNYLIIYTDGVAIQNKCSAWAFSSQMGGKIVRELSGMFKTTKSCFTMEVRDVMEDLQWLTSQENTDVCILSDYENAL